MKTTPQASFFFIVVAILILASAPLQAQTEENFSSGSNFTSIWKNFLGSECPELSDLPTPPNQKPNNLMVPIFGIGYEILKKWNIENFFNVSLDLTPAEKGWKNIDLFRLEELKKLPQMGFFNNFVQLEERATFMELIEILTLLKIGRNNLDKGLLDKGDEIIIWSTGRLRLDFFDENNKLLLPVFIFDFFDQEIEGKIGTIYISLLPEEFIPLAISKDYLTYALPEEISKDELYSYFVPLRKNKGEMNYLANRKVSDFKVVSLPVK